MERALDLGRDKSTGNTQEHLFLHVFHKNIIVLH